MPFTTALIMGGLGMAQGAQQANTQKKQNKLNADISAAQTQYSPWTGITPSNPDIKAVDATGSALAGGIGGAFSGYMQGKNSQAADEQNKFMKELAMQGSNAGGGGNAWANMKPSLYRNTMQAGP